jgi:hypothetical protein
MSAVSAEAATADSARQTAATAQTVRLLGLNCEPMPNMLLLPSRDDGEISAHPTSFLNSAFATFSSVERGMSSTKRISRGTLKSANAPRQAAMTLS